MAGEDALELEDMIAEEDMVIAITSSGYIKRLPVTTYREQRRGGIGVMGMDMKDDDYIEHLFVASTHDFILFFTTVGKVYRLKVHELPLGSRQSKGRAIVNLLPFRQGERVRAVIATRNYEEAQYLLFATKKRRRQEDGVPGLQHPAQGGRDHRDQDARGRRADRRAALRPGKTTCLMVSRGGSGDPLPREGRALDGPTGVRSAGDAPPRRRRGDRGRHRQDDADLLVVTENGWGKRTRVAEYPVKGRGGLGVKTAKLVEGKGKLAGARIVREGMQVMLISDGGTVIKIPVDGIKRSGRSTQGVIVMRLREAEQVSSLALVAAGEGESAEDDLPETDVVRLEPTGNGSGELAEPDETVDDEALEEPETDETDELD